ncbi:MULTISPECIES: sigma-70 family RNA polymerase sigma factor [Tissierellales]|jgi:RNA polymerase sigma factor for flagellar operon FliA|uniref:FliA/WhiG family RNA polymerase sigma factor n=1 Tax=Acidilutibacter cellobiosedens TaxID=2507161 RepID=A0A410QC79_9FIRM|nr:MULTISPECIES: FliA/WhiG family RNA polymerase sigma factor [Tissierellales]MBE6081732.1 FliA/WhiG family RNA polymerase sigma factor [Tissierellaceae bacterium]QAT61633.1 FliA/WhiG family RNA polymerase sigma factor [Acidilutibacter cellobiosedens]SCL83006.1 Sigma-28 [Sporanaerobacter sp. PP17-6a]
MTTKELWYKYKETNDMESKKELIEKYVPLVKVVAGRMFNFYGSKIEYDDLVGFGVLGLIDSIERFDLHKNIKFETYAQIRIKGAIIDNIRKLDWIPRSLRKKSKDVQKAIFELENKLGYNPSNEQISEYLHISLKEVENMLSDITTFNVVSLEDFLNENGEYFFEVKEDDKDTPERVYEKDEIKKILVDTIDALPEKEKLIISLYYYEELTYKEIGHILKLSESRISQIHSRVLIKIKNCLIKSGINSNDLR